MTETPDSPTTSSAAQAAPKKRSGGLSTMLLADLKSMAAQMGIAGAGGMKKAQLVEAIKAAQSGSRSSGQPSSGDQSSGETTAPSVRVTSRSRGSRRVEPTAAPAPESTPTEKGQPENGQRSGGAQPEAAPQPERSEPTRDKQGDRNGSREERQRSRGNDRSDEKSQDRSAARTDDKSEKGDKNDRSDKNDKNSKGGNQGNQSGNQGNQGNQSGNQGNATPDGDDDGTGRSRNRRRRGRDRNRPTAGGTGSTGGSSQRNEPDTTILEDDVLVPAAGILDVLDNYAFVRTSGYLAGPDDVYLSLSMVRKFGLRRGDAVVGQVRQPREGERKEKFNPMVRIDNVNGVDPETAKHRAEFSKLTPLHPSERLRLETGPTNLVGRVIDVAAPIGKGQRGMIVSPAKAGKTTVLKSIAASITANNPECHLMVVLVDERPEEVTDFERSVKGEVIASTFDRPAGDHTSVAELAIERAKRLVELGHDVVVLLDGLTRLGRAYNLSTPASGRILSGGVDSSALYPPKKFFGAARNIEDGGSLTIIATALVESGSKMDEVIFEEFEGTGNMELRLRSELAEKRLFPSIDAVRSSTRREELLMSEEEMAIVWQLRRTLAGLESERALELLLERLQKTQTNIEFLMQLQKSPLLPGPRDA